MKQNCLKATLLFFLGAFSIAAFASTLDIYEKPKDKAKVIAAMESGEQVMPIFYTEKKDWVKVANPKNGDVGWAKVSELKGPIVVTSIHGTETHQQIIADKDSKSDKDKQPQVYSVIQTSGSQDLKFGDAQKIVKEVEKHTKKMEDSMQQMQKEMQQTISEMFKGFDKGFDTFSITHPIIVVPDVPEQSTNKVKKK